jgi:predicted nucleic acid-binding protein
MLEADAQAFREAWRIFSGERRSSKILSFTDSTTLALMNIHSIRHVATFDGDFQKIESIDVITF